MLTLPHRNYLKQVSIVFIIAAVLLSGILGFSRAQAGGTDVGYKDFSMSGVTAPTGQKPQSKLWFNDGIWWGAMYNKATTSKHFEIYRFDWATDTWITTGVMVDARPQSSADALWTGSKLYTVSNVSPGASGDVNIYVMRYSYNSTTKTYSVDSGFPVSVYNHTVETVVMDQDTTDKLWVTFTHANSSGGRNAYVTHTTTSDTTWITPYIVPVSGANTLESDDISTVVAYSGKIGVMWSNQNDSTVYFAYHPDGTADNNWTANPAVQSPKYADDHLNIKSLQADSAGQLFAVVKTSLNDVNSSTSTKPLVLLLQLDNQGGWTRHTVWRIVDNVTRPIVLLDQQNRNIYAFTTVNRGSQDSGAIYYKTVSLDNPSMQFVDGLGTPFIVSSTDTHINNASSTKQTLNSTTNLLVIAGDDSSHYYFHNKLVLGTGSPTPTSTATDTPASTNTPTATPTDTLVSTSTSTVTNTPTDTPTDTSTNTPVTATPTNTPTQTPTGTATPTNAPYDKDTVGVFRPSNGVIYLKNSNTTGYADVTLNYGQAGDYPVTADWNGDGVDTIGVYRGDHFYLRNSNSVGYYDIDFVFGQVGDQPIAGDWDGDGIDTIGVYRSSNFTFYLRNSNSAGAPDMIFSLGIPGDIGIAGDWTGKGYDTVGVFRPSNGVIFLKNTNATGYADIAINYGIAGDKPVTGDWNNDGVDTIGVLRGNVFYLRDSNTIGFADYTFALGNSGDMPIAGNWDGKP